MLYHPPLLYLGADGLRRAVRGGRRAAAAAPATVPAVAARLAGRSLTVAMAAGAHWAYVELGLGRLLGLGPGREHGAAAVAGRPRRPAPAAPRRRTAGGGAGPRWPPAGGGLRPRRARHDADPLGRGAVGPRLRRGRRRRPRPRALVGRRRRRAGCGGLAAWPAASAAIVPRDAPPGRAGRELRPRRPAVLVGVALAVVLIGTVRPAGRLRPPSPSTARSSPASSGPSPSSPRSWRSAPAVVVPSASCARRGRRTSPTSASSCCSSACSARRRAARRRRRWRPASRSRVDGLGGPQRRGARS